jgi:hypothetical protein
MLATGNSGSKYRIVICPVSNKFTEDDVEALSNYLGERDTSKISRYAVLPELHNILLMNHKVVSKDDRMNSFLKKLLYSSVHMYEEDADTDLFYTQIQNFLWSFLQRHIMRILMLLHFLVLWQRPHLPISTEPQRISWTHCR